MTEPKVDPLPPETVRALVDAAMRRDALEARARIAWLLIDGVYRPAPDLRLEALHAGYIPPEPEPPPGPMPYDATEGKLYDWFAGPIWDSHYGYKSFRSWTLGDFAPPSFLEGANAPGPEGVSLKLEVDLEGQG